MADRIEVLIQTVPEGVEERGAGAAQASTHDDDLGVEGRDQIGETDAGPVPDRIEQLRRGRV